MKYLREEIADPAFLNLIQSFLTAGYKDPKTGAIVKQKEGIPQGGVVSPIICNIVMHKFDEFMEKQIAKFETGKYRRHNPEYQKVVRLRKRATTTADKRKYLKELRKLPHGDNMDPNFKRMMYIRYADDFVILITGTRDEAKVIKLRCKDALKRLCGAELNEEKTLITNIKEGFTFLGAYIRKLPRIDHLIGNGGKKVGNRVTTRRLLVGAPMEKILELLVKNGVVRRNRLGNLHPISITSLTNLSHYDIITYYNQRINGILNYYSFASNRAKLGTVI